MQAQAAYSGIVAPGPAPAPLPVDRVVFYGTGRQAANILLCIRKRLGSAAEHADLELVGVGCRDHTLDAFSHRMRQLFPRARHRAGAHNESHEPFDDRTLGFVVTPPSAHEAGLSWLIDHGVRRIVVEKPIAASRTDLHAIGGWLSSAPDAVCIQEQYLYSRLYDELLDLVRNPAAYIANRTLTRIPASLSIIETVTHFYKHRVRDLLARRHGEHICMLELPHVVTLLYNAFGRMNIRSADVDDLHHRSSIYRGYRSASIVLGDGDGRQHKVALSNVMPCKRLMVIRLSGGYTVELRFPGKLQHDATLFESRVLISHGRQLLHVQTYPDDHLTTAVRNYLDWDSLLGTFERCYEPSSLLLDLLGR